MAAIVEYLNKLKMMRAGVSIGELERRWKEVRKAMSQKGLDVIICEGTFSRFGGYPRWFTDRGFAYNTIVAFPIEGDLIFATHGGGHVLLADSIGVKQIGAPICQTYYANTMAPWVVDALKPKKPAMIGIAGYGTLSAASYLALTKGFPESKFVDATDLVDEIKAVKSEEELRYIRRTAEMHEAAMEVAVNAVKPGKTAFQVMNEVRCFMLEQGSTEWISSGYACPPGEYRAGMHAGPTHRIMKDGWIMGVLMEFNGPEGYYNEVERTICIGSVPKELEETWADLREARSIMVKKLIPHADPTHDVLKALNSFLKMKGYPEEDRTAGHGQGYDLMERPAFSPLGEPIKLKADMVVSLHPSCHGNTYWITIADDYLVTDTGGKRIQENPEELYVV